MDLYTLLRISFYAMAGASALALSIATRNPLFVAGTLAAALLAHFAVDKKKVKPVRIEYIAALGVAVLFYTLLPLREERGWEKHTPDVFAYFLAALQPLLFFLPFSAMVLLGVFFCGLTIVILSGVMDPNASLLFRMALYVAVTAWALFVHALWSARERFSYRASQNSARLSARVKPVMSQPERALPRRAVYQGLAMIAVLTSLCLIFGLFLFFSTPRLNDTVSYIMAWLRPENNPQLVNGPKGGAGVGTAKDVGWTERVSLAELGPIFENQRAAVSINFTPDANTVADASARVYLRGTVFSDMREGAWLPDGRYTPLGFPQGGPLDVRDPTLGDDVTFSSTLIQQQVETLDTASHYFFSVGPIARLSVPQADMDREGMLRLPGDQAVRNYTVWSRAPKFPSNVQLHARAEHPFNTKYIETWLSNQDRARLLPMAVEITKDSATDLGKALAIQMFLRNNARYEYTLRLDELDRRGDPIVEFLASEDPAQRRGHCSYFASAFVTLCRLKGIPARLAGGFAGTLPEHETEPARRVIFKNSDAHAWAEVYFKGEGWVIFDPTPGLGPVNPNIAAEPRVIPTTGASSASSEGFWSYFTGFDSQQQREMYERIGLALQDGVGDAGDIFTGSGLFGWVGAFIAWVGAGMFVVWISRALMTRSRRRSSISPQLRGRARAAVTFYNDLLQALSRCGFTRRPEQTPREFARHVLQHGGERFRCVVALTDVFERVRYGGGEISQDQFNQLQEALDQLREQSFVLPATGKEN